MLVASYAFGWFALLADEYKQLGMHIAAGAGFFSNFALWNEAGYFDNSSETKPLLHLWSLGIEEQFYIVWPLLLWAAWKKKFNLLTITILVLAISFYLNVKGIKKDAVATFYSPQTRFWELLCGSVLAWVTLYKKDSCGTFRTKLDGYLAQIVYREKPTVDGNALSNVISFIGMSLLVYGFWKITKEARFPGTKALFPVLGTVLIIAAGPTAWINRTILSNKIAVWFGLISFPLYLWHWPLLSFARIVESEVPSRNIRIAAVLISIVLAWLTYKLIERPIRFGGRSKHKVSVLVLFMLVVGGVGYATYKNDGLKSRSAELSAGINRFDQPYKESCEQLTGEIYGDDWCNAGTASINKVATTVMIGDSHSNAYAPMLSEYTRSTNKNFSFVQLGRGQCPALLDYGPDYCRLISNKSFEFIKNNPAIKTIILASDWGAYANGKDFQWVQHKESGEAFRASFEKTVLAYRDIGKDVVMMLAVPTGSAPQSCILRPMRITNKNICNLAIETARSNDRNYRESLLPLLTKLDIAYFDPFVHFCDDIECRIAVGTKIFSADGGHMSIFGGEYLAAKGKGDLDSLFKVLD